MTNKSLLSLLLLSLLALNGCNDKGDGPRAQQALPEARVAVEAVAPGAIPSRLELVATLQATEQATVAARVNGQVTLLPVEVGSQVAKGALLVKIGAAEIAARAASAETLLTQARRNLEREAKLLEVDASTRETVRRLQEQVEVSKAAYDEARTMLEYTTIAAPFAGTVTAKMVEVGDLATVGIPLLRLENVSLEAVAQVPEQTVRSLAPGQNLLVSVPTAGLEVEAKISEIAPTVDPASRTVRVKLALPLNPGLHGGQFARVQFSTGHAATLSVAATALRHNGQMEQVFVAEDGKARLRLVRSGARLGEGKSTRIEILTGLRAGDRVILDPPVTLRDGQPLVIADGSAQ